MLPTPANFVTVGQILFGKQKENWELGYSASLNLAVRTIRRLASGEMAISPEIWNDVGILCRRQGDTLQLMGTSIIDTGARSTRSRFAVGDRFVGRRSNRTARILQVSDNGWMALVEATEANGRVLDTAWVNYAQFSEHWVPMVVMDILKMFGILSFPDSIEFMQHDGLPQIWFRSQGNPMQALNPVQAHGLLAALDGARYENALPDLRREIAKATRPPAHESNAIKPGALGPSQVTAGPRPSPRKMS